MPPSLRRTERQGLAKVHDVGPVNIWLKASNPEVRSHRLHEFAADPMRDQLSDEIVYAGRRWSFHRRRFEAFASGAEEAWLVFLDSGPAVHH